MTTDISTLEGLIKDLTAIVATTNDADDKMGKAREKHAQSMDSSVRAFATRIAGINDDLDAAQINQVCESVADRIAKGNANIRKARKSEIKLMLTQRTHIAGIIGRLDAAIDARKDDTDARAINLRAATLKALRSIKDGDAADADEAVDQFLEAHDHVKSDLEKAAALVGKLKGHEKLTHLEDGTDERKPLPVVERFFEAVLLAIGGDSDTLDELEALVFPEGAPEAVHKPSEDDVLAGVGITLDTPEDAAPAPAEAPQEATVEVTVEPEKPKGQAKGSKEPVEEPFDLEGFTGGLLDM